MEEEIGLSNLGHHPEPELEELGDDDDYEQTNIDDDDPSNERFHTPIGDVDEDNEAYNFGGSSLRLLGDNQNTNLLTHEESIDVLNTIEFLDNVVVDYPEEYKNPNFIRYLIREHKFNITKTNSIEGNDVDYEINYYGKPYLDENLKIRPAREYYTDGGEFSNDVEYQQFKSDLDYLYDRWKSEVRKREIKRAGIVGGVLIAIAGLISGLSLGLTRTGHSMVHDSKMKWKKLTPAEKKQIVIPWTELEKASGKGAIIVGDYIYVLIGGAIIVYALRK